MMTMQYLDATPASGLSALSAPFELPFHPNMNMGPGDGSTLMMPDSADPAAWTHTHRRRPRPRGGRRGRNRMRRHYQRAKDLLMQLEEESEEPRAGGHPLAFSPDCVSMMTPGSLQNQALLLLGEELDDEDDDMDEDYDDDDSSSSSVRGSLGASSEDDDSNSSSTGMPPDWWLHARHPLDQCTGMPLQPNEDFRSGGWQYPVVLPTGQQQVYILDKAVNVNVHLPASSN